MTPLEQYYAQQNRRDCRHCTKLLQLPKDNRVEGTDHINFCQQTGEMVLEMHLDTNNRVCCVQEKANERGKR